MDYFTHNATMNEIRPQSILTSFTALYSNREGMGRYTVARLLTSRWIEANEHWWHATHDFPS